MLLNRNLSYFRLKSLFGCLSRGSSSSSKHSNLISLLQDMPKDPKHVVDAQKQRTRIKERMSRYIPGKVTVQVLGTGARGAPTSLYLFTDHSRYLFNCGEGTQRLAHEHKMKLSKLEHIFITQQVWKNIGGLPGTALTIQDVGVPKITLHGPKGLDELFKATKRFVVMKNLELSMAECNENTSFEDNVMSVEYVPIIKAPFIIPGEKKREEEVIEHSSDEDVGTPQDRSSNNDKGFQMGSPTPEMADVGTSTLKSLKRSKSRLKSRSYDDENLSCGSDNKRRPKSSSPSLDSRNLMVSDPYQHLIDNKDQGTVISYICRLKPRPGILNLDECVKRGVPPGPLLGQLKNGKDVTLQDGKVVKSVDVREPDDPGPVFLVVDCPSDEYLDNFISNVQFKKHQSTAKHDDDLAYLVVHFTPRDVIRTPKYQEWIESFSPSTRHLVLNDGNTCMGSIAVHRIQHKLNILSNNLFPLLKDVGTELVNIASTDAANFTTRPEISDDRFDNIEENALIQAKTFCTFHLRPRKGLDESGILKLSPHEYLEETMIVQGFNTELTSLRSAVESQLNILKIRSYPKVLFLGTGSCIPNKTRNTSGILLQTSEYSNILIDCGEGTYGQLVRFFGTLDSLKALANTDAVYISHLHADHHIGLIGFLLGRRDALQTLGLPHRPVYLLAPKQILSWLQFYDDYFEDIATEYILIPNGDLTDSDPNLAGDKSRVFERLNMKEINTCFVRHCPNAFGVAFCHRLGYKITYSGDTMPCDELINLGMNSDLLIHEATMEDELSYEAELKLHSTTSQAIAVGHRMKAKYILLTHFSQRYAKLPRFNENFTSNVGIAFDNMMVKLDELPLVPLLYPALKVMFADHYEELELKAMKRQMRKDRDESVESIEVNTKKVKLQTSSSFKN